jgi:excisionase family DNA binding protein
MAIQEELDLWPADAQPALITIKQAARVLNLGRSTIYELSADGRLEVVHIGRPPASPLTPSPRSSTTSEPTRRSKPDHEGRHPSPPTGPRPSRSRPCLEPLSDRDRRLAGLGRWNPTPSCAHPAARSCI